MGVYYYGYPDAKADDRWLYWEQHRPSAISLDVETVSLSERHPVGIGIGFSPYEAFYFTLEPEHNDKALEALGKFCSNIQTVKLAHNWMFDMGEFPLIPVINKSLDRANIFDTNVAARLMGYEFTDLPFLAGEIGMQTTGMGEIFAKYGVKDNMQLIAKNPEALAEHCAKDCMATYGLYLQWKDKIAKQYGEYFKVEMAVIPILLDVSMHGIAIDQQSLVELTDRYTTEVEFYERQVKSYGIDKPGSPQQVGYMLAKRGSFLKFTKNKKQLQTRAKDLEFLDDPLAATVLGYRTRKKFLSTYLLPLKGEDRFYTEYYLDTVVGRLNSRNKNIQNIPGADPETGDPGARFMMIPDNGLFTTGDFGREHLYILANMSQDRGMLEVLYNPDRTKADIHQHTADLMHVPRKLAKVCNFAVIYGATAQTLMEQLHTQDRPKCEELLEGWFRAYPGAADWIKYAENQGMNAGWSLPTLFGRRIKIQPERDDQMRRKCVNYPILGSDGEVIKRGIILCNNRRLGPNDRTPMVITVHDSITWDGDVKDKLPVEEMEHIFPGFYVPFEIKQTFRWE